MDHDLDVRKLREAFGWNQQQLGEACGVDRSTVSKWEKEPPAKGPALILLRQLAARANRPEKFDPSCGPSGHLLPQGEKGQAREAAE
jgi:transcriptional regulator with XRE-family HTH domain